MYPYVKDHGIEGLSFRFFDVEATDWYDPLKPYTLLEYQWVRANVAFSGQIVFDAGSHHGNYAVIFNSAESVCCFDKVPANCEYCVANLSLNGLDASYVFCSTLAAGNLPSSICDLKPDVYKMDIEGDEFVVLPDEISANPQVHTWIVEVHPHAGDPNALAKLFAGYELLKVDREAMTVRPYSIGESWAGHSTLIARKLKTGYSATHVVSNALGTVSQ